MHVACLTLTSRVCLRRRKKSGNQCSVFTREPVYCNRAQLSRTVRARESAAAESLNRVRKHSHSPAETTDHPYTAEQQEKTKDRWNTVKTRRLLEVQLYCIHFFNNCFAFSPFWENKLHFLKTIYSKHSKICYIRYHSFL